HRVVHGGEGFDRSVLIDDEVINRIEAYRELAPLHNPPNLAGIKAARRFFGHCIQVASFDTAFHRTIPEVAYLYAIPYRFYQQYGIRRYGFHGTSHRYVARRAAELLGRDKYSLNAITCHLGNGCSVTAVRAGRSVDTSMGLTPLEGLIMGTRSGDIDPGVILFLAERLGLEAVALNRLLNRESGLLGISGLSNDFRNLLQAAEKGNRQASLAIDMFCYRLRKYVGSYLTVLGQIHAIVFTGGIGENVPLVREKSLAGLEGLGIILDREANYQGQGERIISQKDSRIAVLVVPTDEELRIAFDTYTLAREKVRP
ncbi:MAG TPA: acetate kinase, partial [bacterium]|nr:acetate kinase [bacterium]